MQTLTYPFDELHLVPGAAPVYGTAEIAYDASGQWTIRDIELEGSDLRSRVRLDCHPKVYAVIKDALQTEDETRITQAVSNALENDGTSLRSPYDEHRLGARQLGLVG